MPRRQALNDPAANEPRAAGDEDLHTPGSYHEGPLAFDCVNEGRPRDRGVAADPGRRVAVTVSSAAKPTRAAPGARPKGLVDECHCLAWTATARREMIEDSHSAWSDWSQGVVAVSAGDSRDQ